MTPLKLTGKLRDRLNNNAKTRQRPHRRTKGCRIHPLARGVNRKCLHQPIRQAPEKHLIKVLFDEQAAIVPQGLFTEIAVRLATGVEGIVPGHVEGQSLHRRSIAQIVQLL